MYAVCTWRWDWIWTSIKINTWNAFIIFTTTMLFASYVSIYVPGGGDGGNSPFRFFNERQQIWEHEVWWRFPLVCGFYLTNLSQLFGLHLHLARCDQDSITMQVGTRPYVVSRIRLHSNHKAFTPGMKCIFTFLLGTDAIKCSMRSLCLVSWKGCIFSCLQQHMVN